MCSSHGLVCLFRHLKWTLHPFLPTCSSNSNIMWRELSCRKDLRRSPSSEHLDEVATDKEIHSGASLWRKLCVIKKYINAPIYVSLLGPDGLPPSGQTKETVPFNTKRILYKHEQLAAQARSKHPPSYKLKPFKLSYVPCEWETFVAFGRASDHP